MLARIIVMFVLLFIVLNISNYSPATLAIASTCQYWIPREIHTL